MNNELISVREALRHPKSFLTQFVRQPGKCAHAFLRHPRQALFGFNTHNVAPSAEPLPAASTAPETALQILERSGLFDEQFYCEANPDVAASEISPLEHYLSVGGFEGRRPNRLFDSTYYLSTYRDVAKAGVNPALHYFLFGALEGRNPSAEFDTSYYLEANPDVVTSGINPLVHFLRFGAAEGRLPCRPLPPTDPPGIEMTTVKVIKLKAQDRATLRQMAATYGVTDPIDFCHGIIIAADPNPVIFRSYE